MYIVQPQESIPDPKNERAFEDIFEALSNVSAAIIGITGAGGAGKTTFAQNIARWYAGEQAIAIDLDDYLLSREERGRREVTGYNPRANKLHLARKHIEQRKLGESIKKPIYDHSSGKILPEEIVYPKPLIIVEGVTALYRPLRDLYSLTIFLDALEETQIKSRIQRDVEKRGYTLDEALALFETIKPDYERFIAPTKRFADEVFEVDTCYVLHPVAKDV